MSIKPLDFPEYWSILKNTAKNILSSNRVLTEEYQKSINAIFSLCTSFPQSNYDELYELTKLLLEEHLLKLLPFVQTDNSEDQLKNYYLYWQKYSIRIKLLNLLYRLLQAKTVQFNKTYGRQFISGHVSTNLIHIGIEELGLNLWKSNIILLLKNSISKLVLDEIDKQRHNMSTTTSPDIIVGVINSFIEVQMPGRNQLEFYKSYFEQPFLEQSRDYFQREAARLLQEFTVSEYLVKALRCIINEMKLKRCLHVSTGKMLQKLCNQLMVIDHFLLIKEEFIAILKEERLDDMRNIYLLLNRNNREWILITDIFRQHIEQIGIKVIKSFKQKNACVNFVDEVMNFHKKYVSIVINVFNNDLSFIDAIDKAFTVIVNHKIKENQRLMSPEYLSNYCDTLLKKSSKGINEIELDNKLLHCITIFKCIHDKDIFKSIYQKQLASRLILQQSQSIDVEERMITQLKKACGYEFTSNLHNMITDVRVSEELNAQFHNEFLKAVSDKLNVSFSTFVLKSDVWPLNLSTTSSFVLPKQLIPCTQYFEVLYKEKYKRRVLTWCHLQSRGELTLNYLPKTYIVKLQMLQMAILLLFEDCDTLKYSEIYDLLQVTNDEFKDHLESLVKYKLLLLNGDNVKLNMAFTNSKTTFQVKLDGQKDRPLQAERSVKTVNDDRKIYLQATIIRIMKACKTLKHKPLVDEIFCQSNLFLPTNALIKSAIEILIDKEYLERNPNVSDEYNYVA